LLLLYVDWIGVVVVVVVDCL